MKRPSLNILKATPAVAFTLLLVLGCSGRELSMGKEDALFQALEPNKVSATATACGQGYAHPNICCRASKSEPAQCGAWIADPFRACDSGWTTYPNASQCCSLSDPTSCVDGSSTPSDTPPSSGTDPSGPIVQPATGSSAATCSYACRPGWYADGPYTCCTLAAGGNAGMCEASQGAASAGCNPCPSGWSIDTTNLGNCCLTLPDGTKTCVAATGCGTAHEPAPLASCTVACPEGWSANAESPDVCCRTRADGSAECFSQASGPAGDTTTEEPAPEPPATLPMSCGGTGSASRDGGSGGVTCGCSASSAGILYDIACDVEKLECTCLVNRTATKVVKVTPLVCDSPQISTTWKNDCQFPGMP